MLKSYRFLFSPLSRSFTVVAYPLIERWEINHFPSPGFQEFLGGRIICNQVKKKTHAQLKKDLWKWFSLYIKQRDGYRCVTCNRPVSGANAQGGHYIAKAACGLDYYFSEINVACQCAGCNLFLEGNRPAFRQFILHRHGADALEDLEKNFRKPCKWTTQDFKDRIAHYKALVA